MEWKITRNGPSELEAWDRYAAAAVEVVASHSPHVQWSDGKPSTIAEEAAEIADALLLERRKRVKDDAEG